MRTHDTRKGPSHTEACLGVGSRRGIAGGMGMGGYRRRTVLGEIPNVDDGFMDAANYHGMCKPM